MPYIPQNQLEKLKSILAPGKVIVLYGPRRVGKTTLIKKFLASKKNALFVSGEDLFVQRKLSSQSIDQLASFLGNHDLLVIDEAQHVPAVGQNLKL